MQGSLIHGRPASMTAAQSPPRLPSGFEPLRSGHPFCSSSLSHRSAQPLNPISVHLSCPSGKLPSPSSLSLSGPSFPFPDFSLLHQPVFISAMGASGFPVPALEECSRRRSPGIRILWRLYSIITKSSSESHLLCRTLPPLSYLHGNLTSLVETC